MVSDRTEVGLPWLVGLRWWAALGQTVVILVVHFGLGVELPLVRVLALVAVTALTNAGLARAEAGGAWRSRTVCGAVLLLDTLVLTGLLHATGGPLNPFSIFYIVHITLAAVVLGAGWTWTVTGLSVTCFGALFLAFSPMVGVDGHVHGGGALSTHLQGMWFAFVLTAALTAFFVVRLSAAIEQREVELVVARERSTRYEKLASLTTLAAGAAHELGTPLATIAVVATEAERALSGLPPAVAEALRADVRLIRTEVARCRRILDAMAVDAGGPQGEPPSEMTVAGLLADVIAAVPSASRARLHTLPPTTPQATVRVPRQALVQALVNVIRNALDASSGAISLVARVESGHAAFVVSDHGPGMSADVLARCTEPFFSTKPTGHGMGLGLFLAKTLAEHLGGGLTIESTPGAGVTVALSVPVRGVAVGVA